MKTCNDLADRRRTYRAGYRLPAPFCPSSTSDEWHTPRDCDAIYLGNMRDFGTSRFDARDGLFSTSRPRSRASDGSKCAIWCPFRYLRVSISSVPVFAPPPRHAQYGRHLLLTRVARNNGLDEMLEEGRSPDLNWHAEVTWCRFPAMHDCAFHGFHGRSPGRYAPPKATCVRQARCLEKYLHAEIIEAGRCVRAHSMLLDPEWQNNFFFLVKSVCSFCPGELLG